MEITALASGTTIITKSLQAPVSKTTSERPRRKRTTCRTFDLDAQKRVVSFSTTVTMSVDLSACITLVTFETTSHIVLDAIAQATPAITRRPKRIQKRKEEKIWKRKTKTTIFS